MQVVLCVLITAVCSLLFTLRNYSHHSRTDGQPESPSLHDNRTLYVIQGRVKRSATMRMRTGMSDVTLALSSLIYDIEHGNESVLLEKIYTEVVRVNGTANSTYAHTLRGLVQNASLLYRDDQGDFNILARTGVQLYELMSDAGTRRNTLFTGGANSLTVARITRFIRDTLGGRVETALHRVHQLIMGYDVLKYSLVEAYYDRFRKRSVDDGYTISNNVRTQVAHTILYLYATQELGYASLIMASKLQDPSAVSAISIWALGNRASRYQAQVNFYNNVLFKDCLNTYYQPGDTDSQRKWTREGATAGHTHCTPNFYTFGAICSSTCRPEYKAYNPTQCLKRGEWVHNELPGAQAGTYMGCHDNVSSNQSRADHLTSSLVGILLCPLVLTITSIDE